MQQIKEQQNHQQTDTFTFIREDGKWYIYLQNYLDCGWAVQDFELIEGAHKILNTLSNGAKKLQLKLSSEPFEGSKLLQLIEHCEAQEGGGIYTLKSSSSATRYWICDFALFVFGHLPEQIYIQRLPLRFHKLQEQTPKTKEMIPNKANRFSLR